MITSCETPNCLKPFSYLKEVDDADEAANDGSSTFSSRSHRPHFYIGVDVARKHDLTVIDVGEKIGDIVWDRIRIELRATDGGTDSGMEAGVDQVRIGAP